MGHMVDAPVFYSTQAKPNRVKTLVRFAIFRSSQKQSPEAKYQELSKLFKDVHASKSKGEKIAIAFLA